MDHISPSLLFNHLEVSKLLTSIYFFYKSMIVSFQPKFNSGWSVPNNGNSLDCESFISELYFAVVGET